MKLFDRAAEPVPLHAGKLRADLRLVAAIAVMRHGHDDRAVEVVLLAELGQCRRIRLAEENRQAGGTAADPIPVDIELPITVARPLWAILGHGPVGGKPRSSAGGAASAAPHTNSRTKTAGNVRILAALRSPWVSGNGACSRIYYNNPTVPYRKSTSRADIIDIDA